MPILAVEGPDLCGKTTLWNELRKRLKGAVFVPALPMTPALLKCVDDSEARVTALWRAVYDPAKLYVFDRYFSVSGPVYAALRGGDLTGPSDDVKVAYIRVSEEELLKRYNRRGDSHVRKEQLSRLLGLYEVWTAGFDRIVLDGGNPVELNARDIARWLF